MRSNNSKSILSALYTSFFQFWRSNISKSRKFSAEIFFVILLLFFPSNFRTLEYVRLTWNLYISKKFPKNTFQGFFGKMSKMFIFGHFSSYRPWLGGCTIIEKIRNRPKCVQTTPNHHTRWL